MKIAGRSLALIGLLGGVGGAINAWLCYAKLPVPVTGRPDFSWHIIPAGCIHGGLLAVVSVTFALCLWQRKLAIRWLGLPIVGWLSGWLSYIPIQLYVSRGGLPFRGDPGLFERVLDYLVWPFQNFEIGKLWTPYWEFGLVGSGVFLLLCICRQLAARRLVVHLLIGSVSGCVGSLLWWLMWKPWYFSLIHGTIWGSLVGFGVWKSQQSVQRS